MQCSGPNPDAEQLQNGGLNRWLPLHGTGSFGYEASYAFRSAMTAGNVLIATNSKGALSTTDPETAEAMKRTVAVYRKVRPYMLGDFYPLFPHELGNEVWYGYQFHRADIDAGAVILFRREKSPDSVMEISLRGLNPKVDYELTFEDSGGERVMRGVNLNSVEVEIPDVPGSETLFYKRAQ